MALRFLHLCTFQFRSQDIRVVGSETDGGTSLSGISDPIQNDGGGYWQADWTDGAFGGIEDDRRAQTLAWRAANAGLSGGQRAVVAFCDRHHQPVNGLHGMPPVGPFSPIPDNYNSGADARVVSVDNGQSGGLNATILTISLLSERPLIGGEKFTYVHPTWHDRAAEISTVVSVSGGLRITFQPPIRGGIAVGDALDFDNVRCTMRRQSQPSNPISLGLYATAAITMVEDMRQPAANEFLTPSLRPSAPYDGSIVLPPLPTPSPTQDNTKAGDTTYSAGNSAWQARFSALETRFTGLGVS